MTQYSNVSGCRAYRVYILHIADRDTVAAAVTHHLILNFFPSRDAALHQNLPHAGETESILQDLHKLNPVVRDPPAAAAKRVGRA